LVRGGAGSMRHRTGWQRQAGILGQQYRIAIQRRQQHDSAMQVGNQGAGSGDAA